MTQPAEPLADESAVSHAAQLQQLAEDRPDEVVYWHVARDGGEPGYTSSWLHDRSSQLAVALQHRGVTYGGRVAIGLRNSPQFLLAVFATWKCGATPVPVRWDLPDWELERVLAVIDPQLSLAADNLPWLDATAADEVPVLPDVTSPRMHGICSSGSTGTPKVIVSAAPAAYNPVFATPIAENWAPIPRPQTILTMAPMYHVNAFATLNNLLAGDRLFVMEKFDAARALDVIEQHRITTFTATPTMLQRMADLPGIDDRDLSSIVWITQGAAPMPPSLVDRWADLIGAERIVMAYGMTEGIGITAIRGDEWLEHRGSVGKGMRGTEIRVLNPDGTDAPPHTIGDIYLRSPSYGGSNYLGDAPPLPSTDDGFRTAGDLGYLDDDGYLYLVDRRVDLIVSGGANVFPAEVETALIDHPGIADVVVVGLKDPQWGRRVHAIVEPANPENPPTADEVIAFAKQRLAAYKVPKTVELVDVMPRSEATKVNRGRLVEERGG